MIGTLLRLSGPAVARRDLAATVVEKPPRGAREEEDSHRARQVVLGFYRLMEQAEFRQAADIVIEL